tara:strand:+ start:1646 stop:2491 length:846 start_codon:yes stop_codon:yes gene_type:complete
MDKSLSPIEQFYFDLEERTRLEKERQEHYDTLSPEEKRAYQKAKRKRGRPKKRYYFTDDTQAAIVAYNQDDNDRLRNKVFNEHIYKAFLKLSENIIHTFKLYHFNCTATQLKHEVVSFLLEKMHKFTPDKGKAFSYFSIVAKHYLIINNNKNYKKLINKAPILKIDTQRDLTSEIVRDEMREETFDFMNQFIEYWEVNMYNVYNKKRDIKIVDAILTLFRERHNIENFNKKALYIIIREMTDVKTLYITRVINTLKKSYLELYPEYEKTGQIHMPKSSFLN